VGVKRRGKSVGTVGVQPQKVEVPFLHPSDEIGSVVDACVDVVVEPLDPALPAIVDAAELERERHVERGPGEGGQTKAQG